MLLHNVLICGLLLLGLLSLAEARRVCKDHSRHCRQLGDKRPRFHCYRKSTQERCCATCRNFENPNNQECLYGDRLAWCSSIGARYSAVSCYTHEVECCDSCSKLSSDKIKDCPYGDREIWCPYFTKERCKDQASRSSCCETCHHLLHGDTTNTHGNKVVTSTSSPTDAAAPSSRAAGGDRNSTNAPLAAVNTSHPVVPTEPNAASRATSVTILKVTENHTDITGLMVKHRDNAGGDVTTTMISRPTTSGLPTTTTESVTTKPSPFNSSPLPADKETPRPTGASSTAGVSGNSSRETSSSTVSSTSAAATSKGKGGNTTIARALSVDNNTRDVTSSSSSPTVTYKPGTGSSSSRTVSLISSSTSPSPSSSSSSPSPSSSRVPTTLPAVVTELHIRLQETPSPSPPGDNDTRVSASHSSYLPSLEDDEDYAQQASGDNDITIDDFTEERPPHEGGGGGHHHEGDHGHHNGNHHGGHHHKKGHHKNGVTAEVPYRYIPAEREDYMFEDYKSSSCRTAARWSAILVPGLLVTWSITGETWRRWVT